MRAVQNWWPRLRKVPVRLPNAWYLNVLLVGEGGNVGPHTDATLAGPAGVPGATPQVVSVLYLRVPDCRGGELVLAREGRIKGVVQPSEGALLHFRGDLPSRGAPGGAGRRATRLAGARAVLLRARRAGPSPGVQARLPRRLRRVSAAPPRHAGEELRARAGRAKFHPCASFSFSQRPSVLSPLSPTTDLTPAGHARAR